ncbi:chemotaxis protein CheD [Paenibacillus apiarius]|uniref:Probable chemoreceptor glutamine deamidase CheD n=1 Tax=Paenibacillus apiarius TaxID=46240 RepID=A0ABT4DMD1_9BACL|nr:chemotaxis protein CheD [Paenibacillus apiarius]MBN3526215.1 chemotaxis protein CheD [Paenibacillus apiarius]MCY9516151.1 chemotaxis protein CheD [Paenibacillus apiarius]MCY9518390.1 chemotaxis protein CheD [Paenibacillus apiarius]MCY9551209.1 chemotaxis protein CheD [Paenibacillus apiarius]MCY9558363.1 chemotaxis protein CheD [Paenibacillus apiarius]
MIEESTVVKVGMADLNVCLTGSIRTTGLGSCVGLTLYDPVAHIAGMAHVMLPSSDIARDGVRNIAKYADTAVPELIRRMTLEGAKLTRLQAKMAGGAQMFAFASNNDMMRIGPRNVESCKQMLLTHGIPLLAEDTGGNYGRTIELRCGDGMLNIRSVQMGVKEI